MIGLALVYKCTSIPVCVHSKHVFIDQLRGINLFKCYSWLSYSFNCGMLWWCRCPRHQTGYVHCAMSLIHTACDRKSWDSARLRMTSVPLLFPRWPADMLWWWQCFRVWALATIWPWMAAPTSVPSTSMVIPAVEIQRRMTTVLLYDCSPSTNTK